MAGYREHITVSGLCGVGYGTATTLLLGFDPVQGAIAGCLTWIGGMLPDLDARGGRPVREITALLAAVGPMIAIRRLVDVTGGIDATILTGILLYAAIRYGGTWLLDKFTVHRGMFHSLPAMLIAAQIVFLAYKSPELSVRLLMAAGVGVGFFSHLLLDEFYSVQWNGIRPRLAKSAGTAIKFFGPGFGPNAITYGLLMFLSYAVVMKSDRLLPPRMIVEQVEPLEQQTGPATPDQKATPNPKRPAISGPANQRPRDETLDRFAAEFGPAPL
ncbi:metal-dependent hydrolase [Stratiformator vulcanicus]|uniref:Inner membrane protein n=1 Tax=Stratiformator vulcanicus TaxID=2527980 RepID=A0A517R2G2_9PLAN|nr:metal-dependent hydrolase [Stratiformator vulcanicus]QDT38062.1 hypothetical protein Pan189_24470 [Stratiformator vulcanicus]